MEYNPHQSKLRLESSISFGREGRIEEWVHDFLSNEGNNMPLLEGLKKQKRFWHGPIEIKLNQLRRTAGPEPEMPYRSISEQAWNNKISSIQEHHKRGGSLPPLIAEYVNGELMLRDGNHRHGALAKQERDSYWTIIWFNSEADEQKFKHAYERK